jgi:dihydroorotate dehydrogenase electron transfer subunit
MKKRIEDLSVIEKRSLNNEFFVLRIHSESSLPQILPGQFAQVKVEGSPSTFLRRPFSIYDVDYTNRDIFLLIKIVGEGTNQLSQLSRGDKLNLIYPLGNSFSRPPGSRVLLIGGGTGVAPIFLLGKYLREQHDIVPHFLLGYRSSQLVLDIVRFKALGVVHVTTEDGTMGHKGYVIHHPILHQEYKDIDMIYTCGPDSMMQEVAKYAHKKNIPCEVSLENLMGCGIGVCLCCVVDTIDNGNINTCIDGPIFNSRKLKWQI